MEAIAGYFENIAATKTYIDRYPASIIDLDALLKGGLLIEFGSGAGNDIKWLYEHGKPAHLMCSFEPDYGACLRLRYNLDPLLGLFSIMHLPINALKSGFDDCSANYVHANNMLLCAGSKDNIYTLVREAYRLLQNDGVAFGRTLSDKIDHQRAIKVQEKQAEVIARALAKPPLRKVERLKRFTRVTNASTRISHSYTEIVDSTTAEGRALLAEYNENRERRRHEKRPDFKEAFVLETVEALREGRLVGIPPQELEHMARSAGFSRTHTEIRRHPWKPTTDFYFRFDK